MNDLVIRNLFSPEEIAQLKDFFANEKATRKMVSLEDAEVNQYHTFEYTINNKTLGKIIIDITG